MHHACVIMYCQVGPTRPTQQLGLSLQQRFAWCMLLSAASCPKGASCLCSAITTRGTNVQMPQVGLPCKALQTCRPIPQQLRKHNPVCFTFAPMVVNNRAHDVKYTDGWFNKYVYWKYVCCNGQPDTNWYSWDIVMFVVASAV